MIITILNNPRLGLKLFVLWLILGVGLLPDKTEGLKCYKCDGAACKNAPPDIDCASGFCLTINKGKDSEKKDCAASSKEGECIKGKGGCFTGTDDNQAEMDGCLGTEAKTAVDKGAEICVCEGDHCNEGQNGRVKRNPAPGDKHQCYKCSNGDDCTPKTAKECSTKVGAFCEYNSDNGKINRRDCFGGNEAVRKCYEDRKCMTSKEKYECLGDKASAMTANNVWQYCICEGNLCNDVAGDGAGSGGAGGGDTTPVATTTGAGGSKGGVERMSSSSFLINFLAMIGISAKAKLI